MVSAPRSGSPSTSRSRHPVPDRTGWEAYDNAPTEIINGLYKAECVHTWASTRGHSGLSSENRNRIAANKTWGALHTVRLALSRSSFLGVAPSPAPFDWISRQYVMPPVHLGPIRTAPRT